MNPVMFCSTNVLIKRLTSIIPDQCPAEYKQVVLAMIKNATTTQSDGDEGKLRKRVVRSMGVNSQWPKY